MPSRLLNDLRMDTPVRSMAGTMPNTATRLAGPFHVKQ